MRCARRRSPMKNRDSQRTSQTAKGIPGLKIKSDNIASPNELTSVITFGHVASSLIDLYVRLLKPRDRRVDVRRRNTRTRKRPKPTLQNGRTEFFTTVSERDSSEFAFQYGWQMVLGNRNKFSFDAYGYRAVTTLEIPKSEPEALSAETIFSALLKNGFS